jgi:hypothetical protein
MFPLPFPLFISGINKKSISCLWSVVYEYFNG